MISTIKSPVVFLTTTCLIGLMVQSCIVRNNPIVNKPTIDQPVEESLPDQVARYYVVIADTNLSYWAVHTTLIAFQKNSGQAIDTMGRYFNENANLLMLPENDEDEIYRGEYYPRRHPSTTLSIEYLETYNENCRSQTFACVVGIYENVHDAAKVVKQWKSTYPVIYSQEADIYVGCMH